MAAGAGAARAAGYAHDSSARLRPATPQLTVLTTPAHWWSHASPLATHAVHRDAAVSKSAAAEVRLPRHVAGSPSSAARDRVAASVRSAAHALVVAAHSVAFHGRCATHALSAPLHTATARRAAISARWNAALVGDGVGRGVGGDVGGGVGGTGVGVGAGVAVHDASHDGLLGAAPTVCGGTAVHARPVTVTHSHHFGPGGGVGSGAGGGVGAAVLPGTQPGAGHAP